MRRSSAILLIIIMLLNNKPLSRGRKAFNSLHFRKISTDFGRKYASSYTAQISADNKAVSMTLDLVRDLTVDLWLKVNITQRESRNRYRNIFAYNMNLCRLLGKAKGMNVFTIWLQNIYRYTNMPMSCPIHEGQYYWKDLRPDKDSIPAFILTGHFRIDALFYMKDWGNAMLTNTTMFVDIKMK